MTAHQVTVAIAHAGWPSECWRAECHTPGCGWQHGAAHEDDAWAWGQAHVAIPRPAGAAGLDVDPTNAELATGLRRRALVLLKMAHQLDPL